MQGARSVAEQAVKQAGPDSTARLSPIEVDLLLAKVYSQWRGHTADAFAVYDRIIRDNPEDFRCAFESCLPAGRQAQPHKDTLYEPSRHMQMCM
jgi:hypothetical protein